jgi:hypothetical protein
MQRWISEDPIGFVGQDPNLNRYVGNAPMMYVDPDGLQKKLHEIMKEMNQENGLYQRPAEAAGSIGPVLETTGELIVETNPITGPLMSECRIFTGYDPLRDQVVNDAQRGREALTLVGTTAIGAIISRMRLGREIMSLEDAAARAARLRSVPLVRQLGHSLEEQRFLLTQTMGKQVGSGRVAHHIIPLETLTEVREVMEKAARGGFDINGCNNGFALLAQYHKGNHPEYNKLAIEALKQIKYSEMNDAEVAAAVQRLADKAREWLSRRRSPLY